MPVWGVDVHPPVPHGPAPRPNVSWRISAHLRHLYNKLLLPTVPKLGWTVGDLAIGVIYLGTFAIANVLFKMYAPELGGLTKQRCAREGASGPLGSGSSRAAALR